MILGLYTRARRRQGKITRSIWTLSASVYRSLIRPSTDPSRKRRLLATSSSYLALLVVYVLIEVLS